MVGWLDDACFAATARGYVPDAPPHLPVCARPRPRHATLLLQTHMAVLQQAHPDVFAGFAAQLGAEGAGDGGGARRKRMRREPLE